MAKGRVYAWGDAECGKIGRASNTRRKDEEALRITPLGASGVQDIFCGKNTSFYVDKKGKLFAFGQNNHGQLGIGHTRNTAEPSPVLFEEDVELVEVNGGEHHSIALTKQGKVYCWGRNDEGQMGLGDIYGEYRRQKAQKEAESAAAEMKAPAEQPAGSEVNPAVVSEEV